MIHRRARSSGTGPVGDLDTCGNPYVDQFIHGRAHGPITERAEFLGKAA
jgi:ABC-type transporter Mla maintaining outer membrane lipid asymmetry ATPase subunit MlaF